MITNALFAAWVLRRWKSGPLLPACVAAAVLVLFVAVTHQTNFGWEAHYFLGGFPRALFGVYAGACLFLALSAIRRHFPVVDPLYLLGALVALLCFDPHWPRLNALPWLISTLLLMPLLVAAGVVAQSRQAAVRRLFAYLGWISYPLYCLHFPVLMAYSLATHNAALSPAGTLACIGLTVSLAHLAARHVDMPLRAWLSRKAFGVAGDEAHVRVPVHN